MSRELRESAVGFRAAARTGGRTRVRGGRTGPRSLPDPAHPTTTHRLKVDAPQRPRLLATLGTDLRIVSEIAVQSIEKCVLLTDSYSLEALAESPRRRPRTKRPHQTVPAVRKVNTTEPIRILSPCRRRTDVPMRTPLTNVPFSLNRSRTEHPSRVTMILACCRETRSSSERLRKLPRQVDTASVDTSSSSASRNTLGGVRPRASWGRSSLYSTSHRSVTRRTSPSVSNR